MSNSPRSGRSTRKRLLAFERRLHQSLADGTAKGEIRPSSILEFPELLLAPALSLNIWMLLFSDCRPIDMERHFEIALDLLLNGLLPRPAEESSRQ